MKKILTLLCTVFLLCACQTYDPNELNSDLDAVFSGLGDIGTYRINNTMQYYSYYLPSDMSEESLDSDAVVLRYQDSRIVMNLNIPNIINARYYPDHLLEDEGIFNSDSLVYQNSGSYTDQDGLDKEYIYSLYRYENTYIIYLTCTDMNYCASVDEFSVRGVTAHLLTIMKNTSVASADVVTAYANKDIIDYKKKQIDLFDTGLPNNGSISSLLIDDAIIGDGVYYEGQSIDENIEEDEIPYEPDEALEEIQEGTEEGAQDEIQ